eukprot:TRINITY_DN13692_c0_g1_i2.p1 TRINITY_DN13692_c0_g1~~TRINITY_DN13692_c0_g1_i2.p1  ORF type:complete len:211 (+),score=57.92 TRINITY_DN13692_c0_g1_i2:16-648(+)
MEAPARQRFLPIAEESEHFEPEPAPDPQPESCTLEDGCLQPLPPPGLPKKRKPNMRVSFNDKVTDLATQEEYARYFEAYVTKCYTGCFDSTPACGIRVRTDTKAWVVRRSLSRLEELREALCVKEAEAEEEEDLPPPVGDTLESTSNFVLHLLREWRTVKNRSPELLSSVLGFSQHAGTVHNYVPWLPTIEDRLRRRLDSQDECQCCVLQ